MATPEEFHRSIEQHWEYWVESLAQKVKSYADACDIVQTVLAEILPKIASIDTSRTDLRVYVARSTRFRAIDLFRANERRSALRADPTSDSAANPEGRTEARLRFDAALEGMTPIQQTVYRLRYQQELDQKEIAKHLGISRQRVNEILHAAKPRQALQRQFKLAEQWDHRTPAVRTSDRIESSERRNQRLAR